MRRLIIEEPYSRSATWSRRLAWFALAVVGLSILIVRQERVVPQTGIVLVLISLGIAAFALLLAVLGFGSVWHHGRRGTARAGLGFAVSAAILAYPAFLLARGATLPALNDVTTDLADPPSFSRSRTALAARNGYVPPDPGPQVRAAQREGYPGIAPIFLDLEPAEAMDAVRDAMEARGMTIIESVPPGGRSGNGRIEAVDRTAILKLADDVTVRIRPRADGARVDIRSASRLGNNDLGANADRIRKLTDAIAAEALAR